MTESEPESTITLDLHQKKQEHATATPTATERSVVSAEKENKCVVTLLQDEHDGVSTDSKYIYWKSDKLNNIMHKNDSDRLSHQNGVLKFIFLKLHLILG